MRKSDAKSRLFFRFSLIFCLFLSLFSITFLTGCGRNANTVVIAGSTSVQPFAEVLAQEYMTLHPGVSIDVQGGGSAAGIMATQSGTTDIGMSSRNLQGSETSLWSIEIARDGIAIIVNPKNPLTGLTLQQVADIYDGKTTNWDQIGGKKGEIDVFTREDGSGTRSSFESLVMGTNQIMARAMVENSNGAIRQLVSDDPGAIGYISLGLVDNTVKALDLGGIVPSRANVVNGTYNLSRPFLFLTLKPPVGLVKDFIDFTMSAQGQQILYAPGVDYPGVQSMKLKNFGERIPQGLFFIIALSALTVLALITIFIFVQGVPLIAKVGFFQFHFRDEMGAQPGLLRHFPDDCRHHLGDARGDYFRRAGGAVLRDFPGGIRPAPVERRGAAGDSIAGRHPFRGLRLLGLDIYRAVNPELSGRAGFEHSGRFDYPGDHDFTHGHQYLRSFAAGAFAAAQRRRVCAGRHALADHPFGAGTRRRNPGSSPASSSASAGQSGKRWR